jgi:hypothetical protein
MRAAALCDQHAKGKDMHVFCSFEYWS